MTCITAKSKFMCSFGIAPSTIIPTQTKLIVAGMPAILATDRNFLPFGSCSSPINPANIPIITMPPCTPQTSPWIMTSTKVTVSGIPVVLITSMTTCMFAMGIIKPIVPELKFNIVN